MIDQREQAGAAPDATDAICRACNARPTAVSDDSACGAWSFLALAAVVAAMLFVSRYSPPTEASAGVDRGLDGGWHVPVERQASRE